MDRHPRDPTRAPTPVDDMKTLDQLAARDKNSFGLLRLCAALMVIVSHGVMLAAGNPNIQPLLSSTDYPIGGHAVHIFFTLSGFLIAGAWVAKPEIVHFLAGRFLRLYPALIAVTLTLLLVCALYLSHPANPAYLFSKESILFFLRTILFLDGGGSLASILPQDKMLGAILATVWTLRFELICYLSIPIVLAVIGSKRALALGIVGLILALCAIEISIFGHAYRQATMLESFARLTFAFYLGVAAWMLRDRIPVSAILAAALLAAAYFGLHTDIAKPLQIIAVGYWAFWLGSLKFGPLTKLANREDISYGIYLIGYPIQQAVALWQPMQGQPAILHIALSLLITVPLAILSWRLIENPSLRHRTYVADTSRSVVAKLMNLGHRKPRSSPAA